MFFIFLLMLSPTLVVLVYFLLISKAHIDKNNNNQLSIQSDFNVNKKA